MSDIVERLRNWRTVHLARLHLLMEEAADEMERLRQVVEQKNLTLTAEEREAVAYYLGTGGPYNVDRTLVALLSRTGTEPAKAGDDAEECRPNGEKCPERERVANYPDTPDSSTLTDAEREAVRFCTTAALPEAQKLGGAAGELCRIHAATLRGLLARLSPPAT